MKNEKRLIILEIILVIITLIAMIFNKNITRQIFAVILLIYMIINKILIKTDKISYASSRKITILLTIMGIIYVSLLYFLGIYAGYYYSIVKLSIWSIINYIIPYVVVIISSEIIRKNILLKENKISKYLVLLVMVMIDVILSTNIYNLETVNDYFTLISFIIVSSIANNILYGYIIKKYRSAKGIIIYRIITTLYMYVIPITPNIYIFLESVIKMVMPHIIYVIIEFFDNKKEQIISVKEKKKNTIILIISCIIIVLIIMLVSCQFKYGVLVVGSGSMTGTINKGDIILYKRYEEEEEVKKGDIIVFNGEGIKVIHRIIDEKMIGGTKIYYTQGDANVNKDEGYRVYEDIVGEVKIRIPYLGYFTLWINDLIGGNI